MTTTNNKNTFDMENLPAFKAGDTAPDFTLFTQKGEEIKLSELTETQKVLLVFYPGDNTPGCTKQLCGIRDIYGEYKKHNVRVLGVNHASAKSHQGFIDKQNYPFDILVDDGKKVAATYGQLKKFFAAVTMKRGVYLIGEDNKILYTVQGMHKDEEVLKMLSEMK